MPRPKNETGYTYWKVRVGLAGGGVLHLASKTEPTVTTDDAGTISAVDAEWLDDHRVADTVGHITWADVRHVTWRLSPAQPQTGDRP